METKHRTDENPTEEVKKESSLGDVHAFQQRLDDVVAFLSDSYLRHVEDQLHKANSRLEELGNKGRLSDEEKKEQFRLESAINIFADGIDHVPNIISNLKMYATGKKQFINQDLLKATQEKLTKNKEEEAKLRAAQQAFLDNCRSEYLALQGNESRVDQAPLNLLLIVNPHVFRYLPKMEATAMIDWSRYSTTSELKAIYWALHSTETKDESRYKLKKHDFEPLLSRVGQRIHERAKKGMEGADRQEGLHKSERPKVNKMKALLGQMAKQHHLEFHPDSRTEETPAPKAPPSPPPMKHHDRHSSKPIHKENHPASHHQQHSDSSHEENNNSESSETENPLMAEIRKGVKLRKTQPKQ